MCQPILADDDFFPAPLSEEEERAIMGGPDETEDSETWTWDTRVTVTDEPEWPGPLTDEELAEAMAEAPPLPEPTAEEVEEMARYFGQL